MARRGGCTHAGIRVRCLYNSQWFYRRVAQAIGASMHKSGLTVDIAPMNWWARFQE